MKVRIFEGAECLDEAIVLRAGVGGAKNVPEVEVRSERRYPGETFEFAFIGHQDPLKRGWRMLFENPMPGPRRCFSQRAPVYRIAPGARKKRKRKNRA